MEDDIETVSSSNFVVLHKLKMMLWQQGGKKDTVDFYVSKIDKSHMDWKSISKKDSIYLQLTRLE